MKSIPNLLVVGAMKAGTTSFHDLLRKHPDIWMSQVKEINYFMEEANYGKGLDWYSQHFQNGAHYKYRGESSTSYTKRHRFPEVVANIKETLPNDIKIIYLLRDPIKRFQSNFTDGKTYLDVPPNYSINEFVTSKPLSENPYVLTGCYHFQMVPYIENIAKENILLIEYEELVQNTQTTMMKVFDFLNIPFMKTELPKLNTSINKRYEGQLVKSIKKMDYVKFFFSHSARNAIRASYIFNTFFKTSIKSNKNLLTPHSIKLLCGFYKPELEALKSDFGFVPRHWDSFNL